MNTPQMVRTCAYSSILITAVLWFTGLVTVPFANIAAKHWLVLVLQPDNPRFAFWAYHIENILYAIGRLPLLFACMVAIYILFIQPKVESTS